MSHQFNELMYFFFQCRFYRQLPSYLLFYSAWHKLVYQPLRFFTKALLAGTEDKPSFCYCRGHTYSRNKPYFERIADAQINIASEFYDVTKIK